MYAMFSDPEAGWGEWAEWGPCTAGERVRRRSCQAGACLGAQLQVARCGDGGDELDNGGYSNGLGGAVVMRSRVRFPVETKCLYDVCNISINQSSCHSTRC